MAPLPPSARGISIDEGKKEKILYSTGVRRGSREKERKKNDNFFVVVEKL
jgi:hypothetical protein